MNSMSVVWGQVMGDAAVMTVDLPVDAVDEIALAFESFSEAILYLWKKGTIDLAKVDFIW